MSSDVPHSSCQAGGVNSSCPEAGELMGPHAHTPQPEGGGTPQWQQVYSAQQVQAAAGHTPYGHILPRDGGGHT
jgi:hypothetical protein